MAKNITNEAIAKLVERAVAKVILGHEPKSDSGMTSRQKAEAFITKATETSIVERGLKVELPVKAGMKVFEGIKLSNGKVAVYVRGDSILKYVWA